MADDFLLWKIMKKPEIYKQVLERILEREIASISYQDSQLSMVVKDNNNTYYAMEMLQEGMPEIPKRVRACCSTIVQELFYGGESYYNLSDVVAIFICPFDLFGAGRAKYVVRNYEDSEQHRLYSDGCTRIILNTKGKADTKELQSFLDYLNGKGDLQDPLVCDLQKEEHLASQNTEWRADYMKLLARDMDQRAIGREEGFKQGFEEGRLEGIREVIRNLMVSNFSNDEIKRLLKVTDEEICMAQKK